MLALLNPENDGQNTLSKPESERTEMYKIVRNYHKGGKRTIKANVSLAEAQAHCQNPESSSYTCNSAASKRITKAKGVWFDSYDEM